jgi:hypothetical protein
MTFLLASRERDDDREKLRFALVNRLFFETKRTALKSTILECEVWRVRVLEFVLERDAFYLPFVFATSSYEKLVFPS